MPKYTTHRNKSEFLLTDSEKQALRLVLEGQSAESIAATMNSSVSVARRHVTKGLKKLVPVWTTAVPRHVTSQPPASDSPPNILPRDIGEYRLNSYVKRLEKSAGTEWACLYFVVLSPEASPSPGTLDGPLPKLLLSQMRHYDVIVQWERTGWVIFLPMANDHVAQNVLNRISGHRSTSMLFGAGYSVGAGIDPLSHVINQAQRLATENYATSVLLSYPQRFPERE